MDDFGGAIKYIHANDIKNKPHEIVYSKYHLTLRKMITKIVRIDQAEVEKLSIAAFGNMCLMSDKKDKII